jgi:hypothetical protein
VLYHSIVGARVTFDAAAVILALEEGVEIEEGAALRLLRSPHCTARAVELLLVQPLVRRSRTVATLLVRHPACPRPFAWETLATLGWRDLLTVASDQRALPQVRRQAERKLAEKVRHLTLGERVSLARLAPRGLLPVLLTDAEPRCVAALLENPHFTEEDAVRLMATNPDPGACLELLHHPRWGRLPGVVQAALHSAAVPLGVALGLVASLPLAELRRLGSDPDVAVELRHSIARLVEERLRRPGNSN